MAVIRFVVGIACMAIMIAFGFGLRKLMFTMGQDFSLGTVFGAGLFVGLQWLYYKLCGKTIFDPVDD